MKHIFCENPCKAQARLDAIKEAAEINLSKVVDLVDSSVANCERCFNIYSSLNQDKKFEISRILNNFSPGKIYDWTLLDSDEILNAYRSVRMLKGAYFGFKSIVFLLKENVKTPDIWAKVKVSRSEIGDKEIRYLTSLPVSVPLVKAWNSILDKINNFQIKELLIYLQHNLNDSLSYDVVEESFYLYRNLLNNFETVIDLLPQFYSQLLRLSSFDTILKNIKYFKDFDIISDVIFNLSCTSFASFKFILENIEKVDFDVFVQKGIFDNFVSFLVKEPVSKDYVYDKEKLKHLFLKISLTAARFSKTILSTTIEKLCLYPDLYKYEQSAYPLFYLGLILDIEIKSVRHITSDPKFVILDSIRRKLPIESRYCDSSVLLEVFSEISLFMPFFTFDIGLIIAKYVKMTSSVAVEFLKIFGSKRIYLEQIEKNFIFNRSNPEAYLKILQFSAPDLILSFRSRAIMNKVPSDYINQVNRYLKDIKEIKSEDIMIISSESDEVPNSSPYKKIEIVIKKTKDPLVNKADSDILGPNKESGRSLFDLSKKDLEKKINTSGSAYKAVSNQESLPPQINNDKKPAGYVKLSRSTPFKSTDVAKQPSIDALKEIAARSKANNPEKEAVLIENCMVKNFKKDLSHGEEHPNKIDPSIIETVLTSEKQFKHMPATNVLTDDYESLLEDRDLSLSYTGILSDSTDHVNDQRKSTLGSIENTEVSNKSAVFITSSPSKAKHKDTVPEKSPSSISSQILKKSNLIFSENVDVRTKERESTLSTLECYYEECVLLRIASPSFNTQEIPDIFYSYQQYYNFFNHFRSVENIAKIRLGILTPSCTYEGTLYSFDSVLRIKTRNLTLENNDLLYISCDKSKMGHVDDKTLDNYLMNDVLLGIVLSSSDGSFINDNFNTNLIDIHVSKLRKINFSSKKIYFRICNSVTSGYREFLALKNIQTQKILKYLLWPPFLSDFLNQSVHWDESKLSIILNKAKKIHLSCQSSHDKKNENALIQILIESLQVNESQASAVSKCYFSKEKFNLIQGPPGTGKTSTILALLSTFLFLPKSHISSQFACNNSYQKLNRPKVLVCAPSNTAIDVFVARLANGIRNFSKGLQKINFLRVGVGANSDVNPYTLDYLVNLSNENQSKSKIRLDLLESADVICSTLNSCVSETVNIKKFDIVIIDEACQATEVSSIIPLRYSPDKIILIGDPKQLPPTSISNEKTLQQSLFERFAAYQNPFLLNTQYRMHPDICNLSSQLFYDSMVMTDPETAEKRVTYRKARNGKTIKLKTLNFIDVYDGKEVIDSTSSFYNMNEAKAAAHIAKTICSKYDNTLNISILSPYKAQVSAIKSHVSQQASIRIEVSTIDSFQGKECDVVVLSTVRSRGLGFICDFRRINVAITRARIGLVILGNFENLKKDPVWTQLMQICKKNGIFCKLKHANSFNQNI